MLQQIHTVRGNNSSFNTCKQCVVMIPQQIHTVRCMMLQQSGKSFNKCTKYVVMMVKMHTVPFNGALTQGWQKRREILIFPRTARNTGNSREILVIPGNYWEIGSSPTRKFFKYF